MERTRIHPLHGLFALCGLISLGAAGGCIGGQTGTHVASPTAAMSATTEPISPTTVPSRGPIELSCASGTEASDYPQHFPTNKDAYIEGVATEFFDKQGTPIKLPVGSRPTLDIGDHHYTIMKSVLYVTPAAAEKTTITLLSPSTAWLDYSDGPIYGNDSVAGATTELIVDSCPGGKPNFHRGGLYVTGPICLKFRVSGAQTVTREVGIGRECPTAP